MGRGGAILLAIAAAAAGIEARGVREDLVSAREATRRAERRLAELERAQKVLRRILDEPPRDTRIRNLLLTAVRIEANGELGSGTVIGLDADDPTASRAWVLTSGHVVGESGTPPETTGILIERYEPDGTRLNHGTATVRLRDDRLDLALLSWEFVGPVPPNARLAPPDRLEGIGIFDPVYAVGCPLGFFPIPTRGEITRIGRGGGEGGTWMMSAQTVFGNSGGGVFLADELEMVGVASRVYAYGDPTPAVIPHLGIVVPMAEVYAWLDRSGYGLLVPGRSDD